MSDRPYWRFRCATSLSLTVFSATAMGAEGISEEMFLQEMPTVLTVSRMAQPQREAPAMVTVIDRKMIEASGFTNIPDLLRLVPGFQVGYARSWQPVVTYHGLADNYARRMQVLVDGRSIFNPSFGQVDWRELPLAIEDIERIEVVHGPAAATYGSNAFSATINIITLQGGDDPGIQFAINQGDHDVGRYLLRNSGRYGDLSHRITVIDQAESRFSLGPDLAHDRFLNARFDYRPNAQDEFTAQLGLTRSIWDSGDITDAILDPPRESDNDSQFIQLRWRRQLAPGRDYSIQYTRSQKDYRDEWTVPLDLTPLGLGLVTAPVDYNRFVRRQQLEFQTNVPISEASRAVYGMELRQDQVRSKTIFHPGAAITEEMYRVFATWEWRPHMRWLANLGGMLEKHYFADTTFSPRLSIHYLPSDRHALRVGISRGYRSQTFYEQVPNFRFMYADYILDQRKVPSPGLEPEVIDSWELGYMGNFPELGLSVNVRLFNDSLSRLIEGTKVPYVRPAPLPPETATQDRNILDARLWGGEYQLQWQPHVGTRVIFNQAWIWQKVQDHFLPGSNDEKEMETSAPRLSWSLLAIKEFGQGWSGSVGYYKVGKMSWLGGDGDTVDGYDRMDIRLAKAWRAAQNRYELAAVLQNLTGAHQDFESETDHRYEARRVFVSFRLWY